MGQGRVRRSASETPSGRRPAPAFQGARMPTRRRGRDPGAPRKSLVAVARLAFFADGWVFGGGRGRNAPSVCERTLSEASEESAFREAHAVYYLAVAEQAAPSLTGP